jgi:hypothetical protein
MHKNEAPQGVWNGGGAGWARLLGTLAWLWLVVALPFLTDASCFFLIALVLAGSWLVLGVAWLGLPLVLPAALSTRSGRGWYLSAAAAGLLGLVLAFSDLGLVARVAVSDPWLTAYAAAVPPGTQERPPEPRWVGLFRVNETDEQDGVVMLYTSQDFLNRQGVARVRPGKTPPGRVRLVRHLYGPWYAFEWHF